MPRWKNNDCFCMYRKRINWSRSSWDQTNIMARQFYRALPTTYCIIHVNTYDNYLSSWLKTLIPFSNPKKHIPSLKPNSQFATEKNRPQIRGSKGGNDRNLEMPLLLVSGHALTSGLVGQVRSFVVFFAADLIFQTFIKFRSNLHPHFWQ